MANTTTQINIAQSDGAAQQLRYPGAIIANATDQVDKKKLVGTKVASLLGLPRPQRFSLAAWPHNYELWVKTRNDGSGTTDKYWVGHPQNANNKYHRSAKDFAEHVVWLLGAKMGGVCECKLCGGN